MWNMWSKPGKNKTGFRKYGDIISKYFLRNQLISFLFIYADFVILQLQNFANFGFTRQL